MQNCHVESWCSQYLFIYLQPYCVEAMGWHWKGLRVLCLIEVLASFSIHYIRGCGCSDRKHTHMLRNWMKYYTFLSRSWRFEYQSLPNIVDPSRRRQRCCWSPYTSLHLTLGGTKFCHSNFWALDKWTCNSQRCVRFFCSCWDTGCQAKMFTSSYVRKTLGIVVFLFGPSVGSSWNVLQGSFVVSQYDLEWEGLNCLRTYAILKIGLQRSAQ